ncbi:MAG: methyltransferase domain-containing protein [Myxococcota bacterium]
MSGVIECKQCPSCGHENLSDLLPRPARVDTTLDLIFEREQQREVPGTDLSSLRTPEFTVCEHCALVFMRKRSTPEAAKQYYAQLFHIIETPIPLDRLPIPVRFVSRKARLARDLVDTLAAHGALEGVESVLHFRCTTGEELRILRDEHGISELYGLEHLPSLVRHAREVQGLPQIASIPVPEFDNPFPRERFDLILCNEAFGHAHDPALVARHLGSLLSDGGAIIAYNEKDHSKILRAGNLFPHGMNFFHKQLYTRASLRSFLASCGYRVESLAHPTVGKPHSLKNSKILYSLRREAGAVTDLPSGEVALMKQLFREWWERHETSKRGRHLLRRLRRKSVADDIGGAARR